MDATAPNRTDVSWPQARGRTDPTASEAGALVEDVLAGGQLRRALSYRKFLPRRPITVLLLESAYHVQGECREAIRALGHRVASVHVRSSSAREVVRAILGALIQVRPDMVLCVNHLGFEDSGTLGSLLEALQMPVACWYVDSPFFVLRGRSVPGNAVTTLFSWEHTLVTALLSLGAQDVHYLPLACDLAKFAGLTATGRYPVSFVGNSMDIPGKKWTRGLQGKQRERANRWRERLLASRACLVNEALALQQEEGDDKVWDALASATYAATGYYRAQLMRSVLAQHQLHIFGDAGWRKIVPQATLHDMVAYGPALATTYRASNININATSLQMPTAVNQRVFDVPAAGGFLLTDHQNDAVQHFAAGDEIITYSDAEHLAYLTGYYATRPLLRDNVVARAQQRIQRDHTYCHRLQVMLSVMIRRHRGAASVRRKGDLPCSVAPS